MFEDPKQIDNWLNWLSRKWQNRKWKITIVLVVIIAICCGLVPMYNLWCRAKTAEANLEASQRAEKTNEAAANVYKTENTRLTRQIQDKEAVIADVKQERDEFRRERDEAKNALAPWVLLANSVISNAPPDKRLDLLLQKVEPIAKMLETLQSLTNAPERKPRFELWADGIQLTNTLYLFPVDSNKVGRINFRIVNKGDWIAENLHVHVSSPKTNVQMSGPFWREIPTEELTVMHKADSPLNPESSFLLGTLSVITPEISSPLAIAITSSRSHYATGFMLLSVPGAGKITPLIETIITNDSKSFSINVDRLQLGR